MQKKFKTNITASMLALALLTTAAPSAPVYAQSSTDLQAQITLLLAQLQALQSQISGTPVIGSYTFTRTLKLGDSGEDVKKLQQYLNRNLDTQVAAYGIGSSGNESMYFGPATAAAVSKLQMKYHSEILAPSGLQSPTGTFGPATMRKVQSLMVTTVTPGTPPTVPTTPGTPPTEVTGSILQGSGDLATFTISGAKNSTINEAASDAPVAELEFGAKYGDLELSRLDISLVANAANLKKNPWDVFETASLWVDGKKIAEQRIDNKSKYLNRNAGTIRFSDLKTILKDGTKENVTVAVSVKNGIRGAGTNADWNISVDRLRYFDADTVASDDTSTGELKKVKTFKIAERGAGEELKFSVGSNNPIEQTVIVDDQRKTTNVTLLNYTIEAIENSIELDRLSINIQTGSAAYADVVSDVRLKIGSKIFTRKDILSTGSYSTSSVLVTFDVDNKVKIKENDKAEVSVIVDLKPRIGYTNGESILAQVTSAERDITVAEGADEVKKFSGTIVGKLQNLISDGVYSSVSGVRFSTATQGKNNTLGVFTAEFQVTAVEGDFYIADVASTSAATTSGGLQFSIATAVATTTHVSASLMSTADEDLDGVFTIREGETETFTLTVVIDPDEAGYFRIGLDTLYFSKNADGVTGSVAYQLKPVSKFKSINQFINN